MQAHMAGGLGGSRHYFCERCALRHNAKSPKCFVCGAATSGIFNAALDIEKRVKQQKQRQQAQPNAPKAAPSSQWTSV